MPEIFNVLGQRGAEILVFNAMAKVAERIENNNDILKAFNLKAEGVETKAEVSVFVNGVEVPFTKCFAEGISCLMDQYEEDVKKKAKELILQTKLTNLQYALEQAEWIVEQELDKLDISL